VCDIKTVFEAAIQVR